MLKKIDKKEIKIIKMIWFWLIRDTKFKMVHIKFFKIFNKTLWIGYLIFFEKGL